MSGDVFYYLAWSCCDGAGSDSKNRFATLEAAIEEADKQQAYSERDGKNEWGYCYRVREDFGSGVMTVYDAGSRKRC